MDQDPSVSYHRGYAITRSYQSNGGWKAYSASDGTRAWFEGGSKEEVTQMIDEALAELPDPVY